MKKYEGTTLPYMSRGTQKWTTMKKYEGIMKDIWRIWKKYEGNMKKYEEIMKEYEENMKKYEGTTLSYMGRGTWKNFELVPLHRGGS